MWRIKIKSASLAVRVQEAKNIAVIYHFMLSVEQRIKSVLIAGNKRRSNVAVKLR